MDLNILDVFQIIIVILFFSGQSRSFQVALLRPFETLLLFEAILENVRLCLKRWRLSCPRPVGPGTLAAFQGKWNLGPPSGHLMLLT